MSVGVVITLSTVTVPVKVAVPACKSPSARALLAYLTILTPLYLPSDALEVFCPNSANTAFAVDPGSGKVS